MSLSYVKVQGHMRKNVHFLTESERVKLGKPDPEMWRKSRPELETLNK